MKLVLVVAGSALGGMARFWLSGFVGRRVGEVFPWGTLAVNASGALALGFVAAMYLAPAGPAIGPGPWHFAALGFLGSYTTVSSFSLQTLLLAREGEARQALANIGLSLGLCLSAAWLGLFAGGRLLGAG
jgi:fluoride exporter